MKSVSLSLVALLGYISVTSAFTGPVDVPGGDDPIQVRAPDASNPSCVFTCIDESTAGQTACEKGDSDCICSNDLTRANLQTCVAASCAPAEVGNANQYLHWYCGGNWTK